MNEINVAIADDNERILDLLGDMIDADKELKLVGKANNGEDAYEMIRQKQPDVVLLDLILPKMDGLSVMDQVNNDQELRKHPDFIVITAIGQERITEDAFKKGASYYILKPFHNDTVIKRIKNAGENMTKNIKPVAKEGGVLPAQPQMQLENRVTDMIHEIGIPAHIKGYHYLRDAIIMAVEDMDVLNASDNSKPRRACNQTCDRGRMEQRQTGYTGSSVWIYGEHWKGETDKFRVHSTDRRYDSIGI